MMFWIFTGALGGDWGLGMACIDPQLDCGSSHQPLIYGSYLNQYTDGAVCWLAHNANSMI
jgi:hypothetical protein